MSSRWRGSESRFPTPWSWRLTPLHYCVEEMERVSSCSGFIMGVEPTKKFVRNAFVHAFWVDPAFQMECLSEPWVRSWPSSEPQASLWTTSVQVYLIYWGGLLSHSPFLSLTTPDPCSNVECQMTISSSTRKFKGALCQQYKATTPWWISPFTYSLFNKSCSSNGTC